MKKSMSVLMTVILSGVIASPAFATAVDYSGIASAVDVSTVAVAIVAMGALKIAPNVAAWAVNKLSRFF